MGTAQSQAICRVLEPSLRDWEHRSTMRTIFTNAFHSIFLFLQQLKKNSLDNTSFLQVSASLTKKKNRLRRQGEGEWVGERREKRYFTHQVCTVGSASAVGTEEICIGGESSANPPGDSWENPVMNWTNRASSSKVKLVTIVQNQSRV